ncbi:MAG TPA: sigma 54-interacting transcriptional regulator, partial [Thermosynechococcaceae cyanobacterium]
MERIAWLRENTSLGALSEEALGAIAAAIQAETVQQNRRIVLEDTQPIALYILRSGHLESYHTSKTSTADAVGLLPSSVLHLKELLLNQPAPHTVITLNECEIWSIPRAEFLALVQQYPEVSQTLSRQLATELDQVSAQLVYERDRQAALRPYLLPKVRRGVVGSSRYAVRLRQELKKASGDRRSVLVFGEPGLGKDNLCALIHFGSRQRHEPMIKVNCDTLQASGTELFGRSNGKPGLLEWLGEGTLLLNNVQELAPELQKKLAHLLATGEYTPITREGEEPIVRSCTARIMMNSEKVLPSLGKKIGHTIKVPPLRVRKADIGAQTDYYINLFCRSRGFTKPKVSAEALRRLQSYDFPGNLAELEGLVERAVIQSIGAAELTEEVFWETSPKAKRFRLNLLNAYPNLRQFLKTPWFPDRLNYGFTFGFFAFVVAVLMLGPQSRDTNFVLNFFWAWWWLGILVAFPFVGRLWCSVCPFMIYGEVAQKLSLWLFPRRLLPWPRREAEQWGGWFLFGLFALILLWEELWDLENTAYLSGCLLLLITAGAVI